MDAQLNTPEGGGGSPADRGWLAAWMLREGGEYVPRFVAYYRRVVTLPHNLRRRLRRTLAVSVTGAALLLALSGPVGPAVQAEPGSVGATIEVVDGEVSNWTNGKCSLVEAILNARATSASQLRPDCVAGDLTGPDTVSLPANGLFVLKKANNTTYGATGLPVIPNDITIEGHGATITRSDAADTPAFRILAVSPSGQLTLRDTTISNGYAYYNSSNSDADYGGGIFSKGGLVVEGSRILANTAGGDYGGLGGGIAASSLILADSIVKGNTATGGHNGILYAYGCAGCAEGGGIYIRKDATIVRSTITGNLAKPGFDFHGMLLPGQGGGIYVAGPTWRSAGELTLINSTVSGNVASLGGGLYLGSYASGDLKHSTLTGNQAIVAESAPYGTIIRYFGTGGGVAVAGGQRYYNDVCGRADLSGVVLAGNTAENDAQELAIEPECAAELTLDAYNVLGHSGSTGGGNLVPGPTDIVPAVGIEAILGPLADNGGLTPTHALLAGSPALDLAPSASCMAEPVNGVDQRGLPRNANGTGGASSNECDAGSFELQTGTSGAFLVSAKLAGTVGGVSFTPGDILKYDPATGWSLYFDGSDVGVGTSVSAFDVQDDGSILISFGARQKLAGVGTFLAQDVARFTPSALGPNTAGTFSWALDGSANHLTLWSERIDALTGIGDGRTAVSTTGTATVQLANGTVINSQDEDAVGVDLSTSAWSRYFNGTAVPGLKGEDVNALWVDPATGELYLSVLDAFDLGGVVGNGKDIIKLTPSDAPGGYTASLWWDGSANGFPTTISGLEILP